MRLESWLGVWRIIADVYNEESGSRCNLAFLADKPLTNQSGGEDRPEISPLKQTDRPQWAGEPVK